MNCFHNIHICRQTLFLNEGWDLDLLCTALQHLSLELHLDKPISTITKVTRNYAQHIKLLIVTQAGNHEAPIDLKSLDWDAGHTFDVFAFLFCLEHSELIVNISVHLLWLYGSKEGRCELVYKGNTLPEEFQWVQLLDQPLDISLLLSEESIVLAFA